MTDAPNILMWANQDPKYPNSFIISNGNQRLLGLTRTDKKGQTYWKFKVREMNNCSNYSIVGDKTKINEPESSPVMDQVQKFHQRQAKTEALNYANANNSASTTNPVNQHS